jgi:hypothetical protein
MDINQNIAQCIQHTNNFGSTVLHNICNGTTQVVPWGGVDWLALAGGASFLAMCLLLFGAMIRAFINYI